MWALAGVASVLVYVTLLFKLSGGQEVHNQLFRVISVCGRKCQGAGKLGTHANASGQNNSLLPGLLIVFLTRCVRDQGAFDGINKFRFHFSGAFLTYLHIKTLQQAFSMCYAIIAPKLLIFLGIDFSKSWCKFNTTVPSVQYQYSRVQIRQ